MAEIISMVGIISVAVQASLLTATDYNELYGVQLDFVKKSHLGLRKFIG